MPRSGTRPDEERLPELVLPVDGQDHRLGPLSARKRLVEYGDFESPPCARLQPIVHELVRELHEELCFVFRNYPQPELHPNAVAAAEAAEAAEMQGKYWLMHDRLLEHHAGLSGPVIRRIAQDLPLDMRTFDRDIASGAAARRVAADKEGALALGVETTPTLFVNGRLSVGSYEFLPLLRDLRSST